MVKGNGIHIKYCLLLGAKLGAFIYFILNPHSKSFNVGETQSATDKMWSQDSKSHVNSGACAPMLVPHAGNSQSINTFNLETTWIHKSNGQRIWILGPKACGVNYPFSTSSPQFRTSGACWLRKGIATFLVFGYFVRPVLFLNLACGALSCHYTDGRVWERLSSLLEWYTEGTNTWDIEYLLF